MISGICMYLEKYENTYCVNIDNNLELFDLLYNIN
jgi:hypothetical protein